MNEMHPRRIVNASLNSEDSQVEGADRVESILFYQVGQIWEDLEKIGFLSSC
jgi:hypothetical protein